MRKYQIVETTLRSDDILRGTNNDDAPEYAVKDAMEMLLITIQTAWLPADTRLRLRFRENGRYYAPVSSLGRTDEDFEDFGIESLGTNGLVYVRKRIFGEQRYFERDEATPGDPAPQLREITEERYRSLA